MATAVSACSAGAEDGEGDSSYAPSPSYRYAPSTTASSPRMSTTPGTATAPRNSPPNSSAQMPVKGSAPASSTSNTSASGASNAKAPGASGSPSSGSARDTDDDEVEMPRPNQQGGNAAAPAAPSSGSSASNSNSNGPSNSNNSNTPPANTPPKNPPSPPSPRCQIGGNYEYTRVVEAANCQILAVDAEYYCTGHCANPTAFDQCCIDYLDTVNRASEQQLELTTAFASTLQNLGLSDADLAQGEWSADQCSWQSEFVDTVSLTFETQTCNIRGRESLRDLDP
jgi:hypothetical protein